MTPDQRLLNALAIVVKAAQPIPAPLGPPMTEHQDTFSPEITMARELLKDFGVDV